MNDILTNKFCNKASFGTKGDLGKYLLAFQMLLQMKLHLISPVLKYFKMDFLK